jgi:hypothetical protein
LADIDLVLPHTGRGFIAALLVSAAVVVSACDGGSSEPRPQVEQGGTVQEAARTWADAVRPLELAFVAAIEDHTALVAETAAIGALRADELPASRYETLRQRFQALLEDARGLPGGTPEIEQANAGMVAGLTLLVSAYDHYVTGIERNNWEVMERGDDEFLEAQSELAKARPALSAIVGPPEGLEEEFTALSVEMRAANIEANEAWKANGEMIDALTRGRWGAAAKKSAKAGNRFRSVLGRLERVPEPSDEHLRTYLGEQIRAFRLLSEAFADYDRGLAARNIALLDAGDKKARQGARLTTQSAQSLLRFLISQSQ